MANRKLASEEVAEIAEARVDKGIKVEDVWNELKFYIVFSPKAVKNLKSLKKNHAGTGTCLIGFIPIGRIFCFDIQLAASGAKNLLQLASYLGFNISRMPSPKRLKPKTTKRWQAPATQLEAVER